MISSILRASALIAAVGASVALGGDFGRDTSPGKLLARVTPEPLPPLENPAYFNTFDKARQQAWTGRYKLALQTLRDVKPSDQGATPAAIALVKAQSLAALGRHGEAMATLEDPAVKEDPAVVIERAVQIADGGDPMSALVSLKQLLARHPESLRGHYELGRIAESVDDTDTAKSAYEWFVAPEQNYLSKWQAQGERIFRSAADATTVGLAIDRWAVLTGQFQKLPNLHQTILDFFVKSYDVIDRQYWPAHYAAAEFYLAHDDQINGQEELKSALTINPNSPESLILYGTISASQIDFDTTDAVVAEVRKENPASVAADLLEARNLLHQRQPKAAAVAVRRVLDKLPNLLEARGLLAATEALQLHDEQTKALLADVDKIAPNDARAYFEVAEQLGAMRQYPRAAAMYKVAIDRAPWWNEPRNGLGLLYTQSGDEDAARIALDAAHNIDPFNVSTTNYLRLLDTMQKMARKESAHFIVVYDPEKDPLIPEYFNDYLESVYQQITTEYRTEPAEKTIIEVFPSHDAFSVRTAGSPWIGTVGASTGRIIALVTPRTGPNTMKQFNWAQVLRHEFTHTVTLAATDNRISHWMTEGLAVYEEHSPLQWAWVPMMYSAVTKDQLFDMDTLTFMFWRPKKPTDRQMAYAQSFWVCTYIEQTYGHEAVLKMLAEFKKGGLQEDVFPMVLHRSLGQFFTEFSAWTKQQVATWGYDKSSTEQYDKLSDRGQVLITSKRYADAVKVWEQIQKLRPMDQLPHQRLAGLYLQPTVNQPLKAIEHLKMLHLLDQRDDRYAKRVARLYRDLNDGANAEAWGLQSVYMDPYDMDAHEILRDACEQAGDQAGLDREKRVIPVLRKWIDEQQKPKKK